MRRLLHNPRKNHWMLSLLSLYVFLTAAGLLTLFLTGRTEHHHSDVKAGKTATMTYPGTLKVFGITTSAGTNLSYGDKYLSQAEAFQHDKNVYDNRMFMPWGSVQTHPADKNYFDFSIIDLYVKTQLGDNI